MLYKTMKNNLFKSVDRFNEPTTILLVLLSGGNLYAN